MVERSGTNYLPYGSEALDIVRDTGSALGNMVTEAGKMAYDVIKDYGRWANNGFPILHPASEGIRRIADGVPYPFPEAPFTGGQCPGVVYRVDAGYESTAGNGRGLSEVFGTVVGTYVNQDPASGLYDMGYQFVSAITGQVQRAATVGGVSGTGYREQNYKPVIYSVERVDGLPDTCGEPIPEYPPIVPPSSAINRTININFSPTLTIPVDFKYIRPEFNLNIDANAYLNAPITINLPDVNLNLSFDAGGLHINFGGSSPVRVPDRLPSPTPQPDRQLPGNPYPEPWTRDEALDVLELLLDIRECACEDDPNLQQVVSGVVPGGIVGAPNRVVYAEVEVTQLRTNNRGQFGEGAPNVEYCGWCWFRYPGGSLSERMPIDATRKRYYPEGDPNSFCFTFQTGNLGFGRITYDAGL